MSEPTKYDKVSEAIVRFVDSFWTAEIEQEIEASYSREVAQATRYVYHETMDCPVDWNTENMDSALAVLAEFFDSRFPWLTPEARTRLNYRFMMTWK